MAKNNKKEGFPLFGADKPVANKSLPKEKVALKIATIDCAECGGQGLKDTTQLCGVCAGTGKSI